MQAKADKTNCLHKAAAQALGIAICDAFRCGVLLFVEFGGSRALYVASNELIHHGLATLTSETSSHRQLLSINNRQLRLSFIITCYFTVFNVHQTGIENTEF